MSTAAATESAPWLEPGELDALKRWARSISFDEIGQLIKLTFAEYEEHKAWRFWPCDRSRQEVREWMKQRQADNERKRKDDERYWKQQLSVASQRDDFVRRKLAKGATTLPKLYESARHSPAFRLQACMRSLIGWSDAARLRRASETAFVGSVFRPILTSRRAGQKYQNG
jgi:hypothetical protein